MALSHDNDVIIVHLIKDRGLVSTMLIDQYKQCHLCINAAECEV